METRREIVTILKGAQDMKIITGLMLIIGGIAFAAWLGGYVMLYGGIVSAIDHVTAGAIIRALFFEAGFIPGWLLIVLGVTLIEDEM